MRRGNLVAETGPGTEGRSARIESLGRFLPGTRLTSEELMSSTRHRTGIDLERLTGIHERRVATGSEDSLSLATEAALDCLARSRHTVSEIEVVVSCSITKYRGGLDAVLEPPMSLAVAERIGASEAVTFDLSNACAGMLTGAFVVADRIRRGEIDCGLVVSGEYISQLGRNAAAHVRSILSPELASLTLGDAGAAMILERARAGAGGIRFAGFTTVSRHSRLCLAYPAKREPGARMFTKSQTLQRFAIDDTSTLLAEALEAIGLTIGDVDWVIPHQTSARAIRKGMRQVSETLGGEPGNPPVVTVDRYGNTASTTHTVAVIEELAAGRIAPGDTVALIALASGIELGVVLFTADEEFVMRHADAA